MVLRSIRIGPQPRRPPEIRTALRFGSGFDQWALWEPGYGPGTLFGRESNETVVGCPNGNPTPQYSLSRLTFTAPDGSETELRDVNTDGSPYTAPNYCTTTPTNWDAGRGIYFESHDGSHLEFVSDASILDFNNLAENNVFKTNGYLYFSDGTAYRIDNSNVTWIRDSNGNKISFSYNTNTNQVISIADQLGERPRSHMARRHVRARPDNFAI